MLGHSLITFIPKYLGSKLSCWYDAANPNNNGTWLANSASLSAWVDLSGNLGNAVQSGSVAVPTFQTNIQNGLPGILFSSPGQLLVAPSSSSLNQQSGLYVFCVCKPSSTVNGMNFPFAYGQFGLSGTTFDWWLATNDTGSLSTNLANFYGINTSNTRQASGETANIVNTPTILTGNNNGTNLQMYVNSVLASSTAWSGTLKTGTNNGLQIGWGPGGNEYTGYLHELLVVQSPSAGQLKLLYQYLSRKWNISVGF